MAEGEREKVDFKTWIGVWGTMLGAFMAVLDIQITNASLRYITGLPPGGMQPVVRGSKLSVEIPINFVVPRLQPLGTF